VRSAGISIYSSSAETRASTSLLGISIVTPPFVIVSLFGDDSASMSDFKERRKRTAFCG
jgi:hypothetical protein